MKVYEATEYGYNVKEGRIAMIEDGYDGKSVVTLWREKAIAAAVDMTEYRSDGRIAIAEVKALDIKLPEGWNEEDVEDDNLRTMIDEMDNEPDFSYGRDVTDARLQSAETAAVLEAIKAHIDDSDAEALINYAEDAYYIEANLRAMLDETYTTPAGRKCVADNSGAWPELRVYDTDGLYLGTLYAQSIEEAVLACLRLQRGDDPVSDCWQDAAGNSFDRDPYEGLPGEGSAVKEDGLAKAVSDYREYQTRRDWSVSLWLDMSDGTVWSRVEYGYPSISYRDPAIVELDPSEDATVAEVVSLAEELIREYTEEGENDD